LVRLWQGFDHPFAKDLQEHATRLDAFKEDLKHVRHRIGFHGSLTRSHEKAGLGIFDVESGRAHTFARLTGDMQVLFLRMISWYMKKLRSDTHPSETMWREFISDMKSHFVGKGHHDSPLIAARIHATKRMVTVGLNRDRIASFLPIRALSFELSSASHIRLVPVEFPFVD